MDNSNIISERTIVQAFSDFMEDYAPNPYINTEWPMENGVYQQYSGYDNTTICQSGMLGSITLL